MRVDVKIIIQKREKNKMSKVLFQNMFRVSSRSKSPSKPLRSSLALDGDYDYDHDHDYDGE